MCVGGGGGGGGGGEDSNLKNGDIDEARLILMNQTFSSMTSTDVYI